MTSCGGTSCTSVRRLRRTMRSIGRKTKMTPPRAEAEADDAIDWPEDEDDARTFGLRQQFAEPEDHAAFVFGEDLNGRQQVEHDDDADNQRRGYRNHDDSP